MEQDPYNQYVVSGCSITDVMPCCSLKWAAVLPSPPIPPAEVGKGAATENLEVDCSHLGELCDLRFFC